MKCVYCNITLNHIGIYCFDCQTKIDRDIIKAQIGLMNRLSEYTNDHEDLQTINARKMEYVGELHGTL